MDKMDKVTQYKAEDIFFDDPNDPNKKIMKIPDEILKKKGWKEGTKVKVSVGDQGTVIIEEVKDETEQESTG
tara:strand:- start:1212 stop:1427 length:216 start_codon:yes stop_codon:yes gene_type:complete